MGESLCTNEEFGWSDLHARLHQTLRSRGLLKRHRRLLVAVSGGQDSLCLIKLLLDLQPKWGWHLAIAHCDHRWSLNAGMAERVKQIAQNWSTPFYLETAVEVTQSEAGARQWRYQALAKIAQAHGYQDIVVGHTKSDRAETLLYNLIRGAGADGLQALTWQRPLIPFLVEDLSLKGEQGRQGEGERERKIHGDITSGLQLVRPLLEISRAETSQFCQDFQLPVWEDAYNKDLKYARNRIRQELLPYIQTHLNPQVEQALAQTGELLRADVEYLEEAAYQLRQQAMMPLSQDEQLKLNRPILRQAPIALQRRVMRQFLAIVLQTTPNFKQIEELIFLITAPNRSRTSSFPGGTIAEVEGDWIRIKILEKQRLD